MNYLSCVDLMLVKSDGVVLTKQSMSSNMLSLIQVVFLCNCFDRKLQAMTVNCTDNKNNTYVPRFKLSDSSLSRFTCICTLKRVTNLSQLI